MCPTGPVLEGGRGDVEVCACLPEGKERRAEAGSDFGRGLSFSGASVFLVVSKIPSAEVLPPETTACVICGGHRTISQTRRF